MSPMKRIPIFTAALAASLLGVVPAAPGAIITPTVTAYSSQSPYGVDRAATRTRDSSGLTAGASGTLGAADSTHGNVANANMWTTKGNTATPSDLDPYITYDLGAITDLQTIRIWNYNENTYTKFGAKRIRVSTSQDNSTWTVWGDITLAKGGSTTAEPAQDFTAAVSAIRYVKFQILSNWDGASFWSSITGSSSGGTDGRYLVGLSEVRFEGTTTVMAAAVSNPSPATGATAIEPDSGLSWDGNDSDGKALSYQLTLGVGVAASNYVVRTEAVAAGAQTSVTWNPPAGEYVIQKDSSFWWRVDKVTAAGVVSGPVWTFTTRAETAAERNARMAWFREGKMFTAWYYGLYCGAEGEWPPQSGYHNTSWTYAEWMQFWANAKTLDYRNQLEPYLTGANFDAAAQARLCKAAGMEMVYVVARHHDGYALWDTATTTLLAPNGFSVLNSPYNPTGRDYLKEIVDALHAEGLRVGLYFSLGDWHHPDFPHDGNTWAHPKPGVADPAGHTENWSNYLTYLHQQVREVLDLDGDPENPRYGRFDVIYFDYSSNGINGEKWGASRLVHMVRQHNPNVIINNRLWNGLDNPNGDFATPEANLDNVGYGQYGDRDWEAIMSVCDPPTWGYGGTTHYPFKSVADLLWDVVDAASKGGTIEVSFSPKADGSIPPELTAQYNALGAWMATNAESIKGTTGNPVAIRPAWGDYTSRRGENRLYMHVFNRPSDGRVVTSSLFGTVRGAWLPANPSRTLTVTPLTEGSFQVDLPADAVDPVDTVIVLDYEFPPALTTSTTVKSVSSENVLGLDRDASRTVDASGLTHGPGGAIRHADGETGKAWTTVGSLGPGTDYAPFIEFDLGEVMNISRIREWGYNSGFLTGGQKIAIIGPDQVDVYTSADGVTYAFAETVRFDLAPGADGYEGHAIPVNYTGIRYIKLVIKTNHDGAVFDGTNTNPGVVDKRSLTGLSEIRFEGVPHPGSHFNAWLDRHGLTGAGRDPAADDDGDGLPNLIEFAVNGDPATPSATRIPQGQLSAGNMVLRFERPDEASGVTLAFQASTDLRNWTDTFTIGPTTGESSSGVTIVQNDANPDTITLSLPLSTHPYRFIRLSAEIPQ